MFALCMGEGEIIDGSPHVLMDGQPAARVGDRILCPDGSIAHIISSESCVMIDNKLAARVGDATSHGGKIITGADTITIADGNVQIVMGNNLQPLGDGKFRLYVNSSNIQIGKNTHFGNDSSDTLAEAIGIGLSITEFIAGIPLDEEGAGEAMQADAVKRIVAAKARGTRTKNRLPNGKNGETGPASGKLEKRNPQTNELQQTRTYDADGKPTKNIDYGHDHNGAGDPHAHDWYYPSPQSPNPVRGPARPLRPGEQDE